MGRLMDCAYIWHDRAMDDSIPEQWACGCGSTKWEVWGDGVLCCAACGAACRNAHARFMGDLPPPSGSFWRDRKLKRLREVMAISRRDGDIYVRYRWRTERGDWEEQRTVKLSTWIRWARYAQLVR